MIEIIKTWKVNGEKHEAENKAAGRKFNNHKELQQYRGELEEEVNRGIRKHEDKFTIMFQTIEK